VSATDVLQKISVFQSEDSRRKWRQARVGNASV
jgi:hypothetical protein